MPGEAAHRAERRRKSRDRLKEQPRLLRRAWLEGLAERWNESREYPRRDRRRRMAHEVA